MATEPLAESGFLSRTGLELETGPSSWSRAEVEWQLERREDLLRAATFVATLLLRGSWEESIQPVLEAVGRGADVSRVHIFENQRQTAEYLDEDANGNANEDANGDANLGEEGLWLASQRFEWAAEGVALTLDNPFFQNMNWGVGDLAPLVARLQNGQAVQGAMSDFSSRAHELGADSPICSLVVVPILVEEQWWGSLGLDECRAPREWDDSEIEVLQLVADMIGAAITRERTDAALRASESELRALFGAMRDPIFVLNREGRYLKIVANNEALLALPLEQIIGKTFPEVVGRERGREFLGVVREVLSTQSLRSLEYRLEIDGQISYFSASVTPLSPETVLWVAHDVTAERQARQSLGESEALFRLLAENSTDKIARLAPDGTFLYISPSVKPLLGYAPEELVGTNPFDMIHPDDRKDVVASLHRIQTVAGSSDIVAYRMRHRSGDYVWFETTSRIVRGQKGQNHEIHTVSRDISERRAGEEALRQAEAKYRSIFENAVEGIFQTTPDGTYLDANPSLARIYGYDSIEHLQTELLDISKQLYLSPRRRLDFIAEMDENGAVSGFEAEIRRRDGQVIWISENARAVRDPNGALLYYEGTVEDITARKNAEGQLLYDALHDKLTGLSNRALFMDRLGQAFARLKRTPEAEFATLFLDFDRFKNVNDSLGHMAGDELLIALAHRIAECLRPGDTVSRLGGDEFAILLEDIADVAGAILVAERIQDAMAEPFLIAGQEIFTSASIGIAMGHVNYQHPEELLRDADMAMYRAKDLGKARHHVFDVGMHQRAVALLQLETDLRHAIERDEFRVHYQPIIDLETGRIAGFEALVRWQHPTRGLVSPLDFIPIAEETGWIVPLGRHVLEVACCQLAQWRAQFPAQNALSMSVNLSSKQFAQRDLLSEIEGVLRRHDLPAPCLKLEITESAIMERAQEITDRLFDLRSLGVQLGLDDFGTGYSSLSYLHRFPLDTLKIDRSFIARMGEDGENREIVRTIVSLGQNLGMTVVAEGVEDASQLAELRALGCNSGQGYFFARPLSAGDAGELLEQSPRW